MNELKIRMYDNINHKMLHPKSLQELLMIERDSGYYEGFEHMRIRIDYNDIKANYKYLEFMLFTGKRDIKRNEIYCGDIIKSKFDGREHRGEVYYDELTCAFLCGNNELYLWELEDIEIVGNVFENDKDIRAL